MHLKRDMVVHGIETVRQGVGDLTTVLLVDQMDPNAVVEQPRTVEVEGGRAVDEDEAQDVHVEINGGLDRLAQPGHMVQCHEWDLG